MKHSFLGCLVLLVAAVTAWGEGEEAPTWNARQRAVEIPMRDGKALVADIHLPPAPGRYPAIVIQTPYGRRHHGAELPGGSAGGLYDREHYAYVVIDWRGFGGSRRTGGRARNGTRGQDGYDAVEWVAAQSWCDAKVGTWGPSALGKVQFDTAAERPPHLMCCVPLVAAAGHRYEDYFEHGVWREQHSADLGRLGFGSLERVRSQPLPTAPLYAFVKRLEKLDRIDVPLLVITGWFDHGTARQLQTFEDVLRNGGTSAREQSRLLVGPWHHTAVGKSDQGAVEFPGAAGEVERETRAFFDRHLRGVRVEEWDARSRVRAWRINETQWRDLDAWPPPGTTTRVFHLHGDGSLGTQAATKDAPARTFVDDPADPTPTIGGANLPIGLLPGPRDQAPLLGRTDVIAYATPPLTAPLRIAGSVRLVVSVSSDRPDVDVAVRLCERTADGRSILIADSIARAQLREPSKGAQPLEPGVPVELAVDLPPLALTVPVGSRLEVLVSGSNWPRYERNPHTGGLVWKKRGAVPAKVSIHHASSRVLVPVLPATRPTTPR